MKWKYVLWIAPVLMLALACPGMAKEEQQAPAPLVDFSSWTRSGKNFPDKTGNAVLRGGETIRETAGPFGGKAWLFDGKKTSAATLDFSKTTKQFDGFGYSLSFWFRCDGMQNAKEDAALSGNTPGLGLELSGDGSSASFRLPCVGDQHLAAWFNVNPGRWNHIALIYSVEQRIKRLYVNGFPVLDQVKTGPFFPIRANAAGKETLGAFKGAVADLKMWDQPVDPALFLEFSIPADLREKLQKEIDSVSEKTGNAPGGKLMAGSLRKELASLTIKKTVPLTKYNSFLRRLRIAEQLIPSVNALKKTRAAAFPFTLLQTRAISKEIRTPLTFPSEAVYTDEITAVAAKDEYTSATFFLFPYRDVKRVEFHVDELKGPGGSAIPASEVELKHVQCWFQPGWNSYFNGHGNYVPGLLLNDPELLRIDEQKKINYLRINYPDGAKYVNICEPGSVHGFGAKPAFQYAFEPVWDADTLQPVDIDFGRNRQFWLDIHAPEDAKPGVYRGKIHVKVEGKDTGSFSLALTVLPFKLPLPRCQFDQEKPFLQLLTGIFHVHGQTAVLKDPEAAKEFCAKHILNLKKHSILNGIVPSGLVSPESVTGEDLENFKLMVRMYREAGLPVIFIDAGSGQHSFMRDAFEARKSLDEYLTEEIVEETFKKFKAGVDKILKIASELTGRHDCVYFYGVDEAQTLGAFREMSLFKDYFMRKGAKPWTSGWENNYSLMPSHEVNHMTAARVERKLAKKWHAIHGELTAYAAPFIGPDNPHLMRYSHGIRMYRSNYNGWDELAYSGGAYHTWNHLFGYDTTYRPFRFIVDTVKGPIINTVAFCGMREGQDDVRYATKLMMLANECMDSGDMKKILLGRKAILWFRNLPFPFPDDLDAMREGMTRYILEMMKALGKDTVS